MANGEAAVRGFALYPLSRRRAGMQSAVARSSSYGWPKGAPGAFLGGRDDSAGPRARPSAPLRDDIRRVGYC